MRRLGLSVRSLGLMVLVLSGIACGGGGEGDGEGTTDEHGNALTTAGGETISSRAHTRWQRAAELFARHEAAGWNDGRCSEAIDAFEDAVDAQDGRFTEAVYMIGVVHQRCGRTNEAREFYNRALSLTETYCKARAAIGLLELEGGNEGAAMQTFQRAIRDDPRCTEGYANLGVIQRRRGEYTEALDNLRRALAVESEYLPAFNQMALLHYERAIAEEQLDEQRLDLAEVVCRQAQLINRDYAPIYNTWGLIKVRRGDIIEALRMFERAVQLNNNIFEAHMNFGQITLSFRGYEDARRSFARAVELQNNSYDAHIGLGAALRGLNQLDQAEAEYNRARELDGNRPEAYFNLGILYQDYKSANAGDPRADIRRATEYFQQFLTKARGNRAYANSVEDVERRCQDQPQGRRGRRRARSTDCRPGRLQNMEQMIRDLDEVGQMQREAEQLQRQQEQQMRELEQQQQQQQQQQPQPQPQGGGGRRR